MRVDETHPDYMAPDLGQRCLTAVRDDERFDMAVRRQAERLLDLLRPREAGACCGKRAQLRFFY